MAKLGANRGKLASYSVAKYGAQQGTDWQWMPDAGNGVRLNGTLIQGDPNDASTPSTVADQKAWIEHLVATHGAASTAKPRFYLYDNEPGLWAETHRDMVANVRRCSSCWTGSSRTGRWCGPPTRAPRGWVRRVGAGWI